MSHKHLSISNKQQNHPKVFFEQYLYNAAEPHEHIYHNASAELESELLGNNYNMKRRFRRIAQEMRDHYS